MTTDLLDTYVEPVCVDVDDDVATLTELSQGTEPLEYSLQAFEVDATGAVLQDISPYLVNPDDNSDELSYDCNSNVPNDAHFTLSAEIDLTWGSSIVALYQLIRSDEYNTAHSLTPGAWLRFPLGQFVVTTPGFDNLDASDVRTVTGYGKNYLLQSSPSDALSFDAGTLYRTAITTVLRAAEVLGETQPLAERVAYPGSWSTKTLRTPHNYPLGDQTHLDIVNDLLKSSGCQQLFTAVDGTWVIKSIPKPARQALRWRWAASEDDTLSDSDLDAKVVLFGQSSYSGDVWNATNQWNFVQSGLDFPPGADGATDGSSGLYQVNNTSVPPTDQTSVRRIVTKTVVLDAAGQDDLVKQGDAFVTKELSQAEKIEITTDPWPAARHFDVFQITHQALPAGSVRRVQTQSWHLPLWGQPMTWETNAVAEL